MSVMQIRRRKLTSLRFDNVPGHLTDVEDRFSHENRFNSIKRYIEFNIILNEHWLNKSRCNFNFSQIIPVVDECCIYRYNIISSQILQYYHSYLNFLHAEVEKGVKYYSIHHISFG